MSTHPVNEVQLISQFWARQSVCVHDPISEKQPKSLRMSVASLKLGYNGAL